MPLEDVSQYVGAVNIGDVEPIPPVSDGVLQDIGIAPYDLIDERRNVQDYHRLFGMPVVIKRAYNSDHIAYGKGPHGENVYRDDTYDDTYGQGLHFKPTAAVTEDGNYWGYSSGWFTYATMYDASAEVNPGERGVYKQVGTQIEIPWVPLVMDNDLVITVEIERLDNQINILATGDRFIIQHVVPVTMRGEAPFYIPNQEREANFYQDVNRMIAQTAQAVRVPRFSYVYDVPILGTD